MKVTDGVKMSRPVTNAVTGEGRAVSRAMSPGLVAARPWLVAGRDETDAECEHTETEAEAVPRRPPMRMVMPPARSARTTTPDHGAQQNGAATRRTETFSWGG